MSAALPTPQGPPPPITPGIDSEEVTTPTHHAVLASYLHVSLHDLYAGLHGMSGDAPEPMRMRPPRGTTLAPVSVSADRGQGRLSQPECAHARMTQWCLLRPKSKAGWRLVPLAPPVVAAIREHLDRTRDIPKPTRPDLAERRRFPRLAQGRSGIMASPGHHRRSACRMHHPLGRRSVGTLLMEAGVDVKIVGEILGHGSRSVAHGYQHVSSELAAQAMAAMAALVRPAAQLT